MKQFKFLKLFLLFSSHFSNFFSMNFRSRNPFKRSRSIASPKTIHLSPIFNLLQFQQTHKKWKLLNSFVNEKSEKKAHNSPSSSSLIKTFHARTCFEKWIIFVSVWKRRKKNKNQLSRIRTLAKKWTGVFTRSKKWENWKKFKKIKKSVFKIFLIFWKKN